MKRNNKSKKVKPRQKQIVSPLTLLITKDYKISCSLSVVEKIEPFVKEP